MFLEDKQTLQDRLATLIGYYQNTSTLSSWYEKCFLISLQ